MIHKRTLFSLIPGLLPRGPGGPSVGVLNLSGAKLDLTGTKVQLGKAGSGGGGPAPGAEGVQQDEWNPSTSK